MSYKPTDDELRVIAFLRRRAQTWSSQSGRFYFDAAADQIERGRHHEEILGRGSEI